MRADSNVDWIVSVDFKEAKSSWELSEKNLFMPKYSNLSFSDISALWINDEMGKSHSPKFMEESSATEIQWMKGENDVRKYQVETMMNIKEINFGSIMTNNGWYFMWRIKNREESKTTSNVQV